MCECGECGIFTTEQGRHKIIETANQQQIIYAMTPFGLDDRIKTPQKQIVRKKEYENEYSITRINQSLHAKLLVTKDYVIHGSCNFTSNSIENEHELIHITSKKCDQDSYKKAKKFFETVWRRSTKTGDEPVNA